MQDNLIIVHSGQIILKNTMEINLIELMIMEEDFKIDQIIFIEIMKMDLQIILEIDTDLEMKGMVIMVIITESIGNINENFNYSFYY